FSIDMIMASEQLYVLEVNPRITASFELYERLNPDLNLVDAHIRVCEGERLSEFDLCTDYCGYRIVYSDCDFTVPAEMNWPQWVKDKPETGREIQHNEPICSVYYDGSQASIPAQLMQYEDQIISLINNKIRI
ncbi:MAG: hypothetical protein AAF372_05460, partial [Pseudomonadota bacterium]